MKPAELEQLATSRGLNVPARSRIETALDKAEAALVDLIALVDLADELAPELGHAARARAGIPEAQHTYAKLKARRAVQDIGTLKEAVRGDG